MHPMICTVCYRMRQGPHFFILRCLWSGVNCPKLARHERRIQQQQNIEIHAGFEWLECRRDELQPQMTGRSEKMRDGFENYRDTQHWAHTFNANSSTTGTLRFENVASWLEYSYTQNSHSTSNILKAILIKKDTSRGIQPLITINPQCINLDRYLIFCIYV